MHNAVRHLPILGWVEILTQTSSQVHLIKKSYTVLVEQIFVYLNYLHKTFKKKKILIFFLKALICYCQNYKIKGELAKNSFCKKTFWGGFSIFHTLLRNKCISEKFRLFYFTKIWIWNHLYGPRESQAKLRPCQNLHTKKVEKTRNSAHLTVYTIQYSLL